MPEQDITLRKLEIFLGYMDTMNISKTAEIMHISPVSVHRALHSLVMLPISRTCVFQ